MRLRPGYFPFVEPGCEYDISCGVCRGAGCRVCKTSGWIELGGAGMVHPAVFEAVGIDPERFTGFAFGLGIDRIAMMRHGIDDLRAADGERRALSGASFRSDRGSACCSLSPGSGRCARSTPMPARSPRRLTARGLTVESIAAAGADTVLDVDVPANRPDCLGHRGLAREVAAAFGAALAPLPPEVRGVPPPSAEAIRVEIEAPDLCARYTARIVRGVRVGPSPAWVRERLEACGLRSINNVVDASNLVLLGARPADPLLRRRTARRAGPARPPGAPRRAPAHARRNAARARPRHARDRRRRATRARSRASSAAPIPRSAPRPARSSSRRRGSDRRRSAATSRRLDLRTDASHRFERGADIEAPLAAQQLAARWLEELAAGTPAEGTLDVYPVPRPQVELALRLEQLERLLGYRPTTDQVLAALAAVDLAPRAGAGGRVEVSVPSWRVDLTREADLVEEVGRHIGYDAIPVSLDGLPPGVPDAPDEELEDRARRILASIGFHEAFGYAMIGDGEDEGFVSDAPRAARLSNPIAEPLACLRRSLLPGLLQALDTNHRRGVRDARLFDVGRVFLFRHAGKLPSERVCAALAWSGAARPRHWSEPARDVDFPEVAGAVERVLGGLRRGLALERRTGGPAWFHPGRSAEWTLGDGAVVARAGALHPTRQRGFEHPIWLAEIDLDALAALAATPVRAAAVPRLSLVSRDLSLRLPRGLPFEEIRRALSTVEAPATRVQFDVIDRYTGPPLPEDEVSLTVRFDLAPDERTLVEAEIEAYRRALVAALERLDGVRLRVE